MKSMKRFMEGEEKNNYLNPNVTGEIARNPTQTMLTSIK